IQPESPFITPLQSDTLFGHLAWAIVYEQGEKGLKEVLAEFNSGSPPFLLSAAFPEGMLPTPVLPPLTREEIDTLAGDTSTSNKRKLIEEVKQTKGIKFIDIATFQSLAYDLSPISLTKQLLKILKDSKPVISQEEVIMHTAIDRISGTAREGSLFNHQQTFYRPAARLTIWLKLSDDSWKDKIHRWFRIIEGGGFGKRKSTGLGQFHASDDIIEADSELPQVANPNAFVLLSSYVPKVNDPLQGYYHYIVKRGKLGGPWALGGRVWKKPLIMFAPGSIFHTDKELAEYYGGLVPEIHYENPRIVQYAYAFPLGIRLKQQGGAS
ncbi:MAG: hypothetical protein QMC90_00995, partial [Dehalococcoidales bacterium]|nr:hypothetical protein [Dehalococcoidales bacterium]